MSAQVTALSEGLLALGAGEGSQAGVLAEVVSQVAALLEGAGATGIFALEKQLDALGVRILDFYRFVPLLGNAFKVFRCEVLLGLYPVFVKDRILVFIGVV
jgi:hypothetical protein